MVVGLEHLGFVKRQEDLLAFDPAIAFQLEAVLLERVGFAEQFGVVRLMEHRLELDAPRIAGWSLAVVVDQDGNAAVDRFGDFGVAPRAEDRAGARVGIQQLDVGAAKARCAAFGPPILRRGGRRRRNRPATCLARFAAEVEDAELEAIVDVGKKLLRAVLEVVQAG